MAWNTAQIITASPVHWLDAFGSTASLFDGSVVFVANLPSGYRRLGKSAVHPPQRTPSLIQIPVRAGVLNSNTKVPFCSAYEPPGVTYCTSWFDIFNALVTGPSSNFTVETDPYTLAIPALYVPVISAVPYAWNEGAHNWTYIDNTSGGNIATTLRDADGVLVSGTTFAAQLIGSVSGYTVFSNGSRQRPTSDYTATLDTANVLHITFVTDFSPDTPTIVVTYLAS